MKNSRTISSNEVQNVIELKQKINIFKHHILNLEKTYSKGRSTSKTLTSSQFKIHSQNSNNYRSRESQTPSQSKLFNRYEQMKLQQITKANQSLLGRMIKIDRGHSQYCETSTAQTLDKARNNFLTTKYFDRKRSLTQISKENQLLNKKLSRCSSSPKISDCNQWKKGWSKNVKKYSENLSNKFPKILHDYRSLAYKEMNKKPQPFNKLKLRLEKKIL